MVASLGEGDDVESPVELTVAAPVEPHPARLARARRDRRHAGEHRERVRRAEPAGIPGPCHERRGRQVADTGQLEERVAGHQALDPPGENAAPSLQSAQLDEPIARKFGMDPGRSPQRPGDGHEVPLPDEVGSGVTCPSSIASSPWSATCERGRIQR
jgi:hypothetical protein